MICRVHYGGAHIFSAFLDLVEIVLVCGECVFGEEVAFEDDFSEVLALTVLQGFVDYFEVVDGFVGLFACIGANQ